MEAGLATTTARAAPEAEVDEVAFVDAPSTPTEVGAGQRLDRLLPWAVAAGLFGVLYGFSLAQYLGYGGHYDLGYFRQDAWMLSHLRNPFLTLRGMNFFGDHMSPLFFLVALPTRVLPDVPWLLATQAGSLALTVVPLYRLARVHAKLRVLPATLLLAAFATYPAVSNVAMADFHPEVLAVPALLGAIYFLLGRRWWPYAACVAVVVLSKEDLALVAGMLGLFAAVFLRQRRVGATTAGIAFAWFLVSTQLVLPSIAGEYIYTGLFGDYGKSMAEVALFMVTHPLRVAGDLATAPNLKFLTALFGPLVALPFAGWTAARWLLPVTPTVLLLLVSTRPSMHWVDQQYTIALMPAVFCSAAFGLAHVHRRWPTLARAVLAGLLLASATGFLLWSQLSPRRQPWKYLARPPHEVARRTAAAMIPPDAVVSAIEPNWVHVAARPTAYAFPFPFRRGDAYNDPVPRLERARGVEFVFVDTASSLWSPSLQSALEEVVESGHFRLVYEHDGILLYAR